MKLFFSLFLLIFSLNYSFANEINNEQLISIAVNSDDREERNILRDKYRNPVETLSFFGLSKEMKVLELTPGRGWYSEILGKYMKGTENYYVAKYDPPQFAIEIINKIQKEFVTYFSNNTDKFGKIKYISINEDFEIISDQNKFDMVLTLRNTHNWLDRNKAEKIYSSIYKNRMSR